MEFSKTKCQINQFQLTPSNGILSKQRSIQISNTDLFSRTTVSRLVEHLFRFILENCPSKNGRNLVQIIIQAKINSYKDMGFSAPRKHFCETIISGFCSATLLAHVWRIVFKIHFPLNGSLIKPLSFVFAIKSCFFPSSPYTVAEWRVCKIARGSNEIKIFRWMEINKAAMEFK